MKKAQQEFSGQRILIVSGRYAGQEGVCLGRATDENKWAVSPDGTTEIVELSFEREFGLLLDMTKDGRNN